MADRVCVFQNIGHRCDKDGVIDRIKGFPLQDRGRHKTGSPSHEIASCDRRILSTTLFSLPMLSSRTDSIASSRLENCMASAHHQDRRSGFPPRMESCDSRSAVEIVTPAFLILLQFSR